ETAPGAWRSASPESARAWRLRLALLLVFFPDCRLRLLFVLRGRLVANLGRDGDEDRDDGRVEAFQSNPVDGRRAGECAAESADLSAREQTGDAPGSVDVGVDIGVVHEHNTVGQVESLLLPVHVAHGDPGHRQAFVFAFPATGPGARADAAEEMQFRGAQADVRHLDLARERLRETLA